MPELPEPVGPKPWHARAVLAVATVAALVLVAVTFSPLRSGFADAPDRGAGDVALYQAEAGRIAQGANYYDAIATELRERGYPMKSIFNWRTPLPVWLVGALPEGGAQVLLMGTAGVMWLMGLALLAREFGRLGIFVGMATISGAVLPCLLDEIYIMPEVWAGVLIGLSAAAYGTDRPRAGFFAALGALLLRELSAPWCLVCLVFDVRARGRRAAVAWAAGFAVYAGLYVLHLSQVLPRMQAGDIAQSQGWVRFGGAGFLISTVQMNIWLLMLPQWLAALYLVLTLVGAAGWSSPAGKRIAWGVVLYVVAFSLAGQAINQYWGSLTAPLFALAAAAAPAALVRLWRAAGVGQSVVASQVGQAVA